jgi:hypothetical protein
MVGENTKNRRKNNMNVFIILALSYLIALVAKWPSKPVLKLARVSARRTTRD